MTQKTDAALTSEINTQIVANGAGAITGPIVNGILNDIVDSKLNRQQLITTARGLISENYTSIISPAAALMVSGTVYYALVGLAKGDIVTSITAFIFTASTGGSTYAELGLYDPQTLSLLATTGNVTTALDNTGFKNISLISPYTVTTTKAYYVAYMVTNAGTPPSLARSASSTLATTVIGSGIRITGAQTGQAALPTTAVIGSTVFGLWAGVS